MTKQYATPAQIIAARKAAGLTQHQAANLIGYSRREWAYWESGQRNMTKLKLDWFVLKTKRLV